MIVVAVIGLLSAIAIPNFIEARARSQATTCIANLRQIDSAIQTWALENNKSSGAAVTPADIHDYVGRDGGITINTTGGQIGGELNCPAGGKYSITTVDEKPLCSLEADGHELAY